MTATTRNSVAWRTAPHLRAVLILGAVSQVGQVLLIREFLMVLHGNELTLGLILAAWLAWVGIGSRAGSALVARSPAPRALLVHNAAAMLLALPCSVLLVRMLRGAFDLSPGAYLPLASTAAACAVMAAPVCLLLGMQFVLLSRVWREAEGAEDTTGASKTYIGEAAGNMAGGLAFTLLMVRYLTPLQSATLAGALMLGTALSLAGEPLLGTAKSVATPHRRRHALPALVLLVAAAAALPFLGRVDAWAYGVKWRQFAPQHQLIGVYQSKHGAISVLEREDQYSLYQSGHLLFSIAGPLSPTPGLEDQEAVTFAHLAMVQHPEPQSVLLIGGGLRGVLSEILKHPVGRVDYVEFDAVLVEAAQPYLATSSREALSDDRVRVLHADGRLFVKGAADRYDLVIVDVPDPTTAVLNRFYTKEFFAETKRLLKPSGVLAIGAVSTPDLRSRALANRNATIYHTLKSAFSHVLPMGERTLYYFASDVAAQTSPDPAALRERYLARGVQTAGFSPWHFDTLLQESQVRRVNWVLRNHGRSLTSHLDGPGPAPLHPGSLDEQGLAEPNLPPVNARYFVNSDAKPILYYYSVTYWDELTRTGRHDGFGWLLRIQPWWAWPVLLGPLLIALALRRGLGSRSSSRRRAGGRFAVMLAAFTTGMSTMALQVALLFSFQSIYGFVYETIGLIVAVFMAGLSAGAYLAQRHIRDKANYDALTSLQLMIAVMAGLIALALPAAGGLTSLNGVFAAFAALTILSGLINGVDFPVAAACCHKVVGSPEASAGMAYGIELFGACLGAAVASVVVVPVLGIVACCVLAALANATAFVVLVVSRRSYLIHG